MVQDTYSDYEVVQPGAQSLSSPTNHQGKHHRIPPSKEMSSQKSKTDRNSMSDVSHASSPCGMTPPTGPSSIETTYFKHHVELTALAYDSISQLYSPSIQKQRWTKIQALVDGFDDRLLTWKTTLDSLFGNPISEFSLDLRQSPLSIALAIQFHCTRAIINRPCLCRQERTTSKQSSLMAVSRCVGSARKGIDLVVNSPANILLHQGPQWWLLLHHLKRMLIVLLLELAFRAEHMPSEAEEILTEAKKAVQWLHGMARASKIAENIWITMNSLLAKAGRRVGIDIGTDDFSDSNVEPFQGWPQYSTTDANRSYQAPMPPSSSHEAQPPTGMQLGVASDPSAFGHYSPYSGNAFQSSRDQEMYQDIMGPEAFDHFSFEPMINGQSGLQASNALYQSAAAEGEMRVPNATSATPQSYLASTLQKNQCQQGQHQHQHQHQGSGARADGLPGSDWFGFDPCGGS